MGSQHSTAVQTYSLSTAAWEAAFSQCSQLYNTTWPLFASMCVLCCYCFSHFWRRGLFSTSFPWWFSFWCFLCKWWGNSGNMLGTELACRWGALLPGFSWKQDFSKWTLYKSLCLFGVQFFHLTAWIDFHKSSELFSGNLWKKCLTQHLPSLVQPYTRQDETILNSSEWSGKFPS